MTLLAAFRWNSAHGCYDFLFQGTDLDIEMSRAGAPAAVVPAVEHEQQGLVRRRKALLTAFDLLRF
ncbi:hypothetical protein ACIBBE_41065 [Streptomyces sp. NPDC051644]|uniref:hypothetical protein n=1 Tax=Streptomyces sp. NPDC051644 TaxID=3365666 RepID=UPI00379DD6F7